MKIGIIVQKFVYEIIDVLETNITRRFSDTAELNFFHLLDSEQLQNFKTKFQEEVLVNLKEIYNNFFDIPKLGNEFSVLFSDEILHKGSAEKDCTDEGLSPSPTLTLHPKLLIELLPWGP